MMKKQALAIDIARFGMVQCDIDMANQCDQCGKALKASDDECRRCAADASADAGDNAAVDVVLDRQARRYGLERPWQRSKR